MSETDDTDVLLLIPPNFFLVDSSSSEDTFLDSSRTVVQKSASCTAQVLGQLVDQVYSLESRLETLELDTSNAFSTVSSHKRKSWDSESDKRSLDRKCFTFPRRRPRKVRKERHKDISLTSLDSITTAEKSYNQSSFKKLGTKSIELPLNDLQSMDGDISSIVSTPSKKNDKLLLHEIDDFLTKVESYETPEINFKEPSGFSPENVIKAAGDYITQKLDPKSSADTIQLPSGRTVSSNVLDKYIYLVRNSANQSPQASTSTNSQADNNRETNSCNAQQKQDLKSPSIRKLNFSENKDVQPTSTPKKPNQSSNYSDTFKPSSNKILDRASKVLEHYKSQNYSQNTYRSMADKSDTMSLKNEEFKMPQLRPFGLERDAYKIDTIDTDLLSLSELWGEKPDRGDKVDNIKLEEERLKREHCEAIIQQLQRKILEQQEKLAVAVKVDRAKDAAINKLKEAWLRLTGSLDKAEERHRTALDKMCREVDNFKMVAGDAQKKTSHFETELYKALDLAHDYQDKCKQISLEKKELQENMDKIIANKEESIRVKEKEIEVMKENYETVMRLNKQSTDCVKNLEDALGKERIDHEQTKTKVTELSSKLQTFNEGKSIIQQERDILKDRVSEEQSRCNILERQLSELQYQVSELTRKYDLQDNETKTLKKQLEIQKVDLKNHYQQQLEDAVLGKLQEFQKQLELAERDMEMAARNKEMHIVETFNKQIVRIEEQHKLEVNVLEEKQKEEIKLYRLQLAQASERISLLENKLDTYRRRRGEIASQLHGVMEAQWRQALRILTSGVAASNANSGVGGSAGFHTSVDCMSPVAEYSKPTLSPPEARSKDHDIQQYIKVLLTKQANFEPETPEPRDNIEIDSKDMYEEPTTDHPERRDKVRRALQGKPPWKA